MTLPKFFSVPSVFVFFTTELQQIGWLCQECHAPSIPWTHDSDAGPWTRNTKTGSFNQCLASHQWEDIRIEYTCAICIYYIIIIYILYTTVGGFKHDFYFPFHIWDVILPIGFHIFQDGLNHQPVYIYMYIYIYTYVNTCMYIYVYICTFQ